MFLKLSLNMGVKSEGIWPLPAFFTLSTILIIQSFLHGVYREFGAKIMEIKVRKLTHHLDNDAEINVNKN